MGFTLALPDSSTIVGHASIVAYGYKQALAAVPPEKKDEKKDKNRWVYRPDDWVSGCEACADNRHTHDHILRIFLRLGALPLESFLFLLAKRGRLRL